MPQYEQCPRWRVVGQSVRGASHEIAGKPNQDAIGWLPECGNGLPLILAVSDGHGSARHFRSAVGSRCAVETATRLIHDFTQSQSDTEDLSSIKHFVETHLPQRLAREWNLAVDTHVAGTPFTDEEWTVLKNKQGEGGREAITVRSAIAYGATLLVVAVTKQFILFVQLGDGDILCVDSAGKVERPFAHDERLIADETSSLCAVNASRDIRVRLVPAVASPPSMILVSTDGYSNSFCDEANFLKVGADLLALIRAEGMDRVAEQLADVLADTSQAGSGDDITLGVIKRVEDRETDAIVSRLTALENGLSSISRGSLPPVPQSRPGEPLQECVGVKPGLEAADPTVAGARTYGGSELCSCAKALSARCSWLQKQIYLAYALSFAGIVLAFIPIWRGVHLRPRAGKLPLSSSIIPHALAHKESAR